MVWKPVVTKRMVHITGWCYEFPFWFSVPGEDVFLDCLLNGQRDALEGFLWGFSPPQPLSSLVTSWFPSWVFGCMRRALWRGKCRNKFWWFHGQVKYTFPVRHGWSLSVSMRCSPTTLPGQCHACNSPSSVPGVGIVHSQAIPEHKKSHSLCIKTQITHVDRWFTTGKEWTVLYAGGDICSLPKKKGSVTWEAQGWELKGFSWCGIQGSHCS